MTDEPQNEPQKSNEDLLIDLIRTNPFITKADMSKKLNLSRATLTRIISNSNRIEYVGPSKGGHWEIKDNK